MVTSKKPTGTKPVDQFISLIKTSDKEEVAAQKTVAKGSVEKKAGETSEKKAPTSATPASSQGTKAAKTASKSLDNKKVRAKKTADTEVPRRRTAKKN